MTGRRFNKHIMRCKTDRDIDDSDFPDFIPEINASHIEEERSE
ncbi:MAG: hypothetical protein ACTSV2_01945 [Candidatus Thorarchaeota archaeon]